MDFLEFPWISLDFLGLPWIFLDPLGLPCIPLHFLGHPWISLDPRAKLSTARRTTEMRSAAAPRNGGILGMPVQVAVTSCPRRARGAPGRTRCPVRGAIYPYVRAGFGVAALLWMQKGALMQPYEGPCFGRILLGSPWISWNFRWLQFRALSELQGY